MLKRHPNKGVQIMTKEKDNVKSLERMDAIDSYFECVTACSLSDEGIECTTECIETHLKEEEQDD